MWVDAKSDGRPTEYRWRPRLNAAVWPKPTARMSCNNTANIGERKTWMQSEFPIASLNSIYHHIQ